MLPSLFYRLLVGFRTIHSICYINENIHNNRTNNRIIYVCVLYFFLHILIACNMSYSTLYTPRLRYKNNRMKSHISFNAILIYVHNHYSRVNERPILKQINTFGNISPQVLTLRCHLERTLNWPRIYVVLS